MKAKVKVVRSGSIVESRFYCGQEGCGAKVPPGARPLAFIPTGKPHRCYHCNRKIEE